MGVIHKLKEEITQFIIQKKQEDPFISCRKIASLINENFQIKISKSSVNTVLKNNDLSSSVGRRSSIVQSLKKFEIPPEKKKKLFFETVLYKQDIPDEKVAEEELPLSLMPDPISVGDEFRQKEIRNSKEKFLSEIKQIRENRLCNKGELYKNMGYIFLKAAEWEISDEAIIGKFLEKQLRHLSLNNFDEICEMMFFFNFLRSDIHEAINSHHKNRGIWYINGFKEPLDCRKMLELTNRLFLEKKFFLEYFNEVSQIIIEINGFKIYLQDGTHIFIDGQMAGIWDESIPLGLSFPIKKALRVLSEEVISNSSPSIFYSIPKYEENYNSFYNMIAVYEALPGKKIEKIVILDKFSDPLTEFSFIPNKKRKFIIGVTPWQNLFCELTKAAKWGRLEPYYNILTDQIIYYTDVVTDILNSYFKGAIKELRTVLIFKEESKMPVIAILTNQFDVSPEEIIKEYSFRWPNLEETTLMEIFNEKLQKEQIEKDNLLKHQLDMVSDIKKQSIAEVFSQFKEDLYRFCQKNYFSESSFGENIDNLNKAFYDISGYLEFGKNLLNVQLVFQKDYQYKEEFKRAASFVNNRKIIDSLGRRLWIDALF